MRMTLRQSWSPLSISVDTYYLLFWVSWLSTNIIHLLFSTHKPPLVLVQFVLGGIAYLYRGRPQVQYRKVETNEAEVSGSETWELERADERATLLST